MRALSRFKHISTGATHLLLQALAAGSLLLLSDVAAAQLLEQSVENLAHQILGALHARGTTKVAIVELTDVTGETAPLGRLIAEELTSQLFKQATALPGGTLTLVERSKLDEVLGEQRLGIQGLLDRQSIEAFGRALGVQAILAGTFAPLEDRVRINARLIAVPSAELFATASSDLSRAGLPARYFLPADAAAKQSLQPDNRSNSPPPKAREQGKPLQSRESVGVRLDVESCAIAGTTVTCYLTFTGLASRDRILTEFAWPPPRLVDNTGAECWLVRLQIAGGPEVDPGEVELPIPLLADQPLSTTLVFEGASLQARRITLLEISAEVARSVHASAAKNPFRAEFSNIPLANP